MNYFVVAFILGFAYIAQASSQDAVLFVWSNQDPSLPNAADFVAVIDYNENSPTYGNILATTSLTQADGDIKTGNEAHHGAVSTNKKYLVTGGLLSFLSAAPALFIFSIDQANPQTAPTFEYSLSVPAGCVDDFYALDSPYDSSFVITAMCSSDATGTGAVFYLNAETQDLWTIIDGTTHQNLSSSFNPHGVDYDVDAGLLVTDYIVASTLLAPAASDIVFKSTIHRFSYQPGDKQAELVQTYEQDVEPPNPDQLGTGQGFMDARYAATDKHNRAYTTSTNTVELFLIDPRQAELKPVLDLGTVVGGSFAPSAGILQSTPDGQRLLVTFEMRYVILLDITDKENPKSLDVFDFCTDPSLDNFKFDHNGTKVTYSEFCAANSNFVGTHVVKLSGNYDNSVENRFTVVNYFLNFGLAQFPGSRTVHSFTFNHDRTKISIDLNFNPNPELYSLGSSPHVALYYPVNSGAQSSGSQQSSSNTSHLAPMLGFLLLTVLLL